MRKGVNMFNLNRSQDKTALSIPKTKKVCGYEIKKLPIGGFLKAIEKMKSMPEDFLNTCFPGKNLEEILDIFSAIDAKTLAEIATVLFVTAPAYIVGFVSELTGIPEEKLLNDESIGISGFGEIILAFLEVNELGKFVSVVGGIEKKIKEMKITPTLTTGYKD